MKFKNQGRFIALTCAHCGANFSDFASNQRRYCSKNCYEVARRGPSWSGPAGFCQCGCGQQTQPAKQTHKSRGYIKGQPVRFIPGHVIKHGQTRTAEYEAWEHIVQRCTNPKCKVWKDYGGRGITVCAEWRDNFEAFLAHVGKRPSPKHSIDRIDNDGNYEPGNMRWATMTQQHRNFRRNHLITINGETKCMQEWAEVLGTYYQSIQHKIKRGTLEKFYEQYRAER